MDFTAIYYSVEQFYFCYYKEIQAGASSFERLSPH